ncbi:head-tail connector protein [Paracoccus haeundaensis]|uniref:head-tail connector protein n=1 Tax=Paracoccus haeundaensis TaxID=225362 RepID=UPI001FE2C2D5|nr:head-tail connector protein [Paracoccus haeundaensis]
MTVTEMKGHLGFTDDQTEDDALIEQKLDSAQSLIENMLGFRLRERFPEGTEIPTDLREAVMQLAAWWFENREAVTERGKPLPFGVSEIIDANRDWSF